MRPSLATGAGGKHRDALHLYRLDADNQDRLVLCFAPLLSIPIPRELISTMAGLREHLQKLLGAPSPYAVVRRTGTGALHIPVPSAPSGVSPLVHRVRTLACAYLEGDVGRPVFPFCLER
ncbi:MAG: hypothetical protein M5U01_33555 [Ardenticatenaceae bacterium]|nr:hypothetical protein [Ardenticatenaceae bacterium]HBY96833.1 hypothetical protein [Chloroflexota bacterium]